MTATPHPYQTSVQARKLARSKYAGSWMAQRIDRFTRRMLLRAYRRYGNKRRAAKALGVTYRVFLYHWARLIRE